jgi:hypothetical protein
VAHELLFPRCCAVVQHGGAGTTARCLLHGLPTVVVPLLRWFDQVHPLAPSRRLWVPRARLNRVGSCAAVRGDPPLCG